MSMGIGENLVANKWIVEKYLFQPADILVQEMKQETFH